MNTATIHLHLTVDEVLQKWPDAFSVFVKNRTKCPGCFMEQFCTLKDVADTYRIPVAALMAEFEAVSKQEPNQRSIP
jgi:hybrid cluster-associated redox disulfide protein